MRMTPASIALCVAASIGLGATAPARADEAPSFDRPGIAFSTGTLPKGRFAWEQGLPDFQRDDDGGVRSTQYNANTTLRLGLSDTVELQLATSP